jgi:acetoin:2,6-dichlorophenolindophenol oxidoreductase subunit alpha
MAGLEESPAEDLYRTIRLIRRFEERAIALVRSGDIASGIHPCIGQEAVAAGVCAALLPDDIIMTHHRGHGHMLAKGTDPGRLLAELCGRVTGVDRGRSGSFHPSDRSAGVYVAGGTVGHVAGLAAGVAWAVAEAGTGQAVVCFFGDGAVSQGALLEAFNLAALWRVPVLFVCESNGYATTVPIEVTLAGSIAGRAAAFGIPADAADGMDPEATLRAAALGLARARAGGGPTLLELRTYRFEGHHTFEHRVRPVYRDEAEVVRWRAKDPMTLQGGRILAERRQTIDADIEALLDEAERFALGSPRPDPADAFDYLYATGLQVRPGVAAC